MELPQTGHEPVLMHEVLDLIAPQAGQTFVDCTLGRAGHAAEVAKRLGGNGLLIGIDTDERNLDYARQRLQDAPCRVRLFHANFSQLREVLEEAEVSGADGILADLGLSTNQLFDPHYGLSFAQDMPLDMRLDQSSGQTAADLVHSLPEGKLADLLYQLADERFSRRIARAICEARRRAKINTTGELADIVRNAVGRRPGDMIDPATRTFLALRMAVNHETENLQALLNDVPEVMKSGGRLGIISFQSTEDRIVKLAFRKAEQDGLLKIVTKKPVVPGDRETVNNPRSRSSKLRVAVKV
jgi:16S rRNA (cytosine1402-N4)-methyltransferase